MKEIIFILALILAFGSAADAKQPLVGDYIRISTNVGGVPSISYEGNITYIGDGLICLNCTNVIALNNGKGMCTDGIYYPFDVCIGTGQISMLVWLVPGEFNYVKPMEFES